MSAVSESAFTASVIASALASADSAEARTAAKIAAAKIAAKQHANRGAKVAELMQRETPPGISFAFNYELGPVLWYRGESRDAIRTAEVPFYGHFALSNDQDVFDEENPHNLRLYDLQLFYAANPDGSVGITRIALRAHKFAGADREEHDVDLTNLYGPYCLLRKHAIYTSNLMLDSQCGLGYTDAPFEDRIFASDPESVDIFAKIVAILARAEAAASLPPALEAVTDTEADTVTESETLA
jgi:hypothetical protein